MKITDKQIKKASWSHYSCGVNCDPCDYRKGGKCDINGCYDKPFEDLYEAFQEGAKWAISQMQPIPTSERLPTKEDSDNLGCVCAYNAIDQFWIDRPYYQVDNPLEFPYWFSYPPLPEPPKTEE